MNTLPDNERRVSLLAFIVGLMLWLVLIGLLSWLVLGARAAVPMPPAVTNTVPFSYSLALAERPKPLTNIVLSWCATNIALGVFGSTNLFQTQYLVKTLYVPQQTDIPVTKDAEQFRVAWIGQKGVVE